MAPAISNSIHRYKQPLALVAVVIFAMATTIFMSRWIDSHHPAAGSRMDEEQLYITANAARNLSLGFRGLVADWYWMRSLQYVGDKIMSVPQDVELDDLSQLNLRLLAPLLDIATTLDPEFMDPYEYAAMVLPAVDIEQAIHITQKGIEANPNAWRLYQHLGYIHWQRGDFQAASEAYGRGARIADAPEWMEAMKARMAAEGGSRTTAREIYSRMFEESGDLNVKEMARRRLLQIESFEQRDVILKVLSTYQERIGNCASSWIEIAASLRNSGLAVDKSGAPLDPSGMPYLLRTESCSVELNPKSDVPYN